MVVMGIEVNREPVGVRTIVAARQAADNRCRLAIVEPHADVHGGRVVDNPQLGALGRRLPFVRVALQELRGRLRVAPGRIVEAAVEARRLGDAYGGHRCD